MTTEQQDLPKDVTPSVAVGEQDVLRSLQDHMVLQAEDLVRAMKPLGRQGQTKGRTQASKALEVAQTAQSLSVFVNWIRYQAARERSADFWSRNAGKHSSLASGVAFELGGLRQQISKAMPNATPDEQADVVMQAATRFLGYFRRALIGADFLDDIALSAPTNQE